ncbi:hypothetical protein ACFLZG_03240 [Thermodesulfobacteriota bacterium]
MNDANGQNNLSQELDDDERVYITDLFYGEIVPKLRRLDARQGTLNCEFAGKRYKNWNIRFRSVGSDFDIEEFEYDEDSVGLELDL